MAYVIEVTAMTADLHFHPPKVAVIETGFVGSTFAYKLMIRGIVSEIVLIDIDMKRN